MYSENQTPLYSTMQLDTSEWVYVAETLPDTYFESACLVVSMIMVVAVLRCIHTQGRRFLDSPRMVFNLMGLMLLINCAGHATVAIALMQASFTGMIGGPIMLLGITMLITGRYAIQWIHGRQKRLGKKTTKSKNNG